ncbi:MAG: sporulation/spore germination protein [Cyanobacteria bacterium J06639_16]
MGAVKHWRRSAILGGLLLLLSGCGSSTIAPEESTEPTPLSTPTAIAPSSEDSAQDSPNDSRAALQTESPTTTPPINENTNSTGTVPVVIYRVNSTCNDFVAEPARVDADQALQGAVRQILSDQMQAEFGLAGFRVSVDADTQIATVDFRLSPDSLRQFVSLSTCEQMALFGSLRQTLLQNSQWQVEEVEFTERGEAIAL